MEYNIMYTKFDIENNTHQCKDCGMKFYNYSEFINHSKKFCVNKGLNTMQGLVQYKVTNVFKDQLKNCGKRSLGLMKYSPTYIEQLPINRPNSHQRNGRYWANGLTGDIGNQLNEKQNWELDQDGKIIQNNLIGSDSLNNFGKSRRRPFTNKQNVTNVVNNSYQHKDNNKQNSISPPSLLISPLAKRPLQTVLNKSYQSIAEMSKSQRKYYAEEKLIQLKNIEDMYDLSGGISMDFRRKLEKMRQFYRKMLEDGQTKKEYPGFLIESQVQQIYSRLKDNDKNKNKIINKYPTNSLDKQIKEKHIQNTQGKANQGQDVYSQPQIQPYNMKHYPYSYPYYPQPQPQIIMIPPYPQLQQSTPQQSTEPLKQQTDYYRNKIEQKNKQNKYLMQLIMDAKRQDQHEQGIQRKRKADEKKKEPLYIQSPMWETPQIQQKILLALQRQELDQLKLFSSLPEELQEVRMDSIIKLTQQRTQLEKEVLQQKAKRLEEQQKNQLYQQQVQLEKNDWVDEKRKDLILHQMGDVLCNLNSGVSADNQDDGSQFDNQEDGENDGLGNEQKQYQEGWQ